MSSPAWTFLYMRLPSNRPCHSGTLQGLIWGHLTLFLFPLVGRACHPGTGTARAVAGGDALASRACPQQGTFLPQGRVWRRQADIKKNRSTFNRHWSFVLCHASLVTDLPSHTRTICLHLRNRRTDAVASASSAFSAPGQLPFCLTPRFPLRPLRSPR